MGATLALRGRAGKPDDEGMPVLPPTTALAEVQRAVMAQLPGATLRRGLFWRYLMSSFVERVEATHERVTITRNGRPAAALIRPENLDAPKKLSTCFRSRTP